MNAKKCKRLRRIAGFHPKNERNYEDVKHRRLTQEGVMVFVQSVLAKLEPKKIYKQLKKAAA